MARSLNHRSDREVDLTALCGETRKRFNSRLPCITFPETATQEFRDLIYAIFEAIANNPVPGLMNIKGLTVGHPGGGGWCCFCCREMPPGPDICLGLLPGVAQACCGHGRVEDAYVLLGDYPGQSATEINDRVTLRGQAALQYLNQINVNTPVLELRIK